MQSLPKKITFSLSWKVESWVAFPFFLLFTEAFSEQPYRISLLSWLLCLPDFPFFLYKLYVCSCKGQILLMMTCLMHQITFLQNSARALQMTALQVLMNKWIKAKHMELLLLFMFSTSGLTKAIDWPEKIFVEF